MLNSTVTRIIFNSEKVATGVEFIKNGQLNFVKVEKEVIVSGGILFFIFLIYIVYINETILKIFNFNF